MPRRILYPFASSGDFREIPDADTTSSGAVTYQTGYGVDYQKRLDVESGAKNIDRSGFNGVLFDTTENIKSWQDQAFPDWYNPTGSATDQGYKKKSVVRYTDGNLYISKINNNRDLPTNSASWEYQYTMQEILATIPQIYRGVAPSSGSFQDSTFQMNGVWDFPTDAMVAGYANTPPGALAGYLTVKVTDGAGKGSYTYYDRTGQVFSMGYDSSLGAWVPWNKKATTGEVFLTNFPVVTGTTDWNTLTSSGSYAVAVASGGPNSPGVNSNGNLLVSSSPGRASLTQIFSFNDGTGKTGQFIRVFTGVTWTAWTFGSSDKVPFSGGSMTGALALFNGSTAPTQAQTDTSDKIANTSFVKAASGNLVAYTPVLVSRTVVASDVGKSLYCANQNTTITMPDPIGLGLPANGGRCVWFFGYAHPFTVTSAPGVMINYNVGSAESITVKTGQFLMLMAISANVWQVMNSTADMFRNADFVNYFNEVATTQPQFDNSVKIATTAYVNRIGLSASQTVYLTSGVYAFTPSEVGKSFINNGSGVANVTLPRSAIVKSGSRISFYALFQSITLTSFAGETIYSSVGVLTSGLTLLKGDSVTLETIGDGAWITVEGSAQLRYSKDFANYFAEVASTAPVFNNSSRIASTEFVQRALGNNSAVFAYNANTALTAANVGSLVYASASAFPMAWVMPNLATLPVGASIRVFNLSTQPLTLEQSVAADKFGSAFDPSSTATSYVVPNGTEVTLTKQIPATWVVSGTGDFSKAGFVSQKSVNGFQYLPNGMIEQWGNGTTSNSSGISTVVFPKQFPNAILHVFPCYEAQGSTPSSSPSVVNAGLLTTSGCQLVTYNGTVLSGGITPSYRAIGW